MVERSRENETNLSLPQEWAIYFAAVAVVATAESQDAPKVFAYGPPERRVYPAKSQKKVNVSGIVIGLGQA